jgi:hypothetical protein
MLKLTLYPKNTSQGFTPSVFHLTCQWKLLKKRNSQERMNLKLINLMITKIPNESKFCGYGQLKGCYWTIPATSTQGTTKEEQIILCVPHCLRIWTYTKDIFRICAKYVKQQFKLHLVALLSILKSTSFSHTIMSTIIMVFFLSFCTLQQH